MKKYGKIFALILIIVVICLSPLSKYFNINHALNVFEQIKANPLAPLIFVMIYATGVVFFLPGLPMTLAAAPLFGFWKWLLLVTIGANIGCSLAFCVSRLFGKEVVERFISTNSFLDDASQKIEKNGFLFMLYVRLIPLFPFNAVNYLSGLTKIRYRDYAAATFIGIIPGTSIYLYMAHSAANLQNNRLGFLISILILVVLTAVTAFASRKKRKQGENHE